MSKFAVGDKVKVLTRSERIGNTGTIVALRDSGYYDVAGAGLPQVSSVTPGAATYHAKSLGLIERAPAFRVGDRVKTKGVWTNVTLEGTISRPTGKPSGFDWFVKVDERDDEFSGLEVVRNSEDLELMQSEPTPTGITLRAGDKIRNRITGREGYVYPAPIARVLKVYDARPPYRDGVPASAVEEYEFHHPGTYELVLRGQGQVF